MKNSITILMAIMVLFTSCNTKTKSAVQKKKPNILLIVGDDIGFGDLASYGSEINTPTMSKLSEHGVQFSNFHASPVCSVTRGMLLTGNNSHEIGLGTFDYAVYPESEGKPGYEGYLTRNTVAISELFRDEGYNVYKTGKWHLGDGDKGDRPMNWGFTKSFGILSGGSNHWNDREMTPDVSSPENKKLIVEGKMPKVGPEPWFLNGAPYDRPNGIYSGELYTEHLLNFMKEDANTDKPWFAYVAFTTAHFPVQAPAELIDKYYDYYYKMGYEGLKEERYKALKDRGLLSHSANRAPSNNLTTRWSDLTEEEKKIQAKIMATYAAMIEDQDQRIGQIIDHLKSTGELDNTLIVYLTDNGPEGADPKSPYVGNEMFANWISTNFDQSLEAVGTENSFQMLGVSWANAATGGLQWWKWFIGEGGIRVPMMIVPPGAFNGEYSKAGSTSNAVVCVKDIPMTILEYAGIKHPTTDYKGREITPPSGKSIKPFMDGTTDKVRTEEEWYAFELFGNSYIMMGDYKAIKVRTGMFGDGEWHLYNVVKDPSETIPLENMQAERLYQMVDIYYEYAKEKGIVEVDDSWSPFKAMK
ncbi:arylsulfatase [Flammeovirga kamogawensis]|uniref:Arylsulfatase n=1 Tax=Flammeovirga kamogawensis TaxID=373891 RepID=A0ABX8H4P8_9BACT|nr:arylsulfatase [Flammeovirga kamogawensis]MBB6461797.1 arylsulfatase [Flammeovirga kamogawensis]QWG10713.1 arylsulfatase [Flammeovirga kamogawensis]